MSRRVKSVAVVGRGAALWMTALGLHRAFSRTGLRIRAVELASTMRPVDVYQGLPTLGSLFRLLGLREEPLVRACKGVISHGQRFSNWSAARAPFLHPYDTHGSVFNNVEFIHYWLKARKEGLNVAFEDFSLGAAAAKQGRFALPTEESFSKAAYGYHLNAGLFSASLREVALKCGIERTATDRLDVETGGERIVALTVTGAERVEADLFVDASGPEAALVSKLPGGEFQSWRRWLACDRLFAASGPQLDPFPAFAQITAFRAGWMGLYPLRDRTAIVAAYDSNEADDDAMVDVTATLSGLRIESDAVVEPFEAGARARPWIGNCVAVGAAAVNLEPLDAVELHLVHMGLSHLIAYFPVDVDNQAEATIYNAAMASHAQNIRDFQITHYKLNQRPDEPFWDRAREMEVPESLAYKLHLFAARGRIAVYDDEAFQVDSWLSSFIGHGLESRDYDPLADLVPREEHMQRFQNMLAHIALEVRAMPSLAAELDISPPKPGSGAGAMPF